MKMMNWQSKKFWLSIASLFLLVGGLAVAAILAQEVKAASATGFLDKADKQMIAGWAKDPDYNGSIHVHVYIDGQFVKDLLAGDYRSDVGNHAFTWLNPNLPPGEHQVRVYAIGVDSSGRPDGVNPELGNSPSVFGEPIGDRYQFDSQDNQVKVVFNKKFGGAITEIYDYENMGNLNLVDGEQAGAMFQVAFWLTPRYFSLPPDCNNTEDMWYENPTQAGYFADGLKGNPIGIWGVGPDNPSDSKEFIRYEDNGKKIHFKSKFIRYNYCFRGRSGNAPANLSHLWDTNFYIEQTAYFHPILQRTLVLESKVTNEGAESEEVSSRQLPIIFAFHLPRVAFWQNGQKVIKRNNLGDSNFLFAPDQNWSALIAQSKESGIGMVVSPQMISNWASHSDTTLFHYNVVTKSIFTDDEVSVLFPGGLPDLRVMGQLNNKVEFVAPYKFKFNTGGSFEWTNYYPIGNLSRIKQSAETILADLMPTSTPTSTPVCSSCPAGVPAKSQGNANCDEKVNGIDFAWWFLKKPEADFNCQEGQTSHIIDINDFRIWARNY